MRGGARGDDRQGERQPGAPRDDLVDRVRCGAGPVGSDPPGEQLARLAFGEHVEHDRVRSLGDDQAGEPVAAGHHDQAAR